MLEDYDNQNKSVPPAAKLPSWLTTFVDVYQQLSIDNLHLLEQVYHPNVIFIDPMHHIQGYESLTVYFKALYQNLISCNFVIKNVLYQQQQAAIYWQMSFQHPRLNGGKPITVDGHSHLKGLDNKVMYHRDYLDLGAMLYEQLPLVGRLIRWVKMRTSQ